MKNVPKLRFKEFSGEWQNKKLGCISDIKTGPFGSTLHKEDYAEVGTPIITVEHLGNEGVTHNNLPLVSDNDKKRLKSYKLKTGDIVFSRVGSVDRSCIVSEKENGWLFSGRLLRVRLTDNANTSAFLNQAFKSDEVRYRIRSVAVGQTMASLNTEILRDFSVTFPPSSAEQTKIADFLTAIDDRISQLSQKCDGLAQYKKGVMQKIFSQELRFKDEKGRAFPAWEEKWLDDFLIQDFREVDKPSGEYLSIGVRSHCKGTFQKPETDPDKNSMEKLFVVHQGDLIVNITFAWEGAIAIVGKEDHGGYVSHRFPTYTFNEKITSADFFRYIFVSRVFRTTLELISPGGAGRNRVLSKKEFLKMKVELPCLKEQEKIAGFLSAVDEKISQAQAQLAALKQYKQGLLQQMFV